MCFEPRPDRYLRARLLSGQRPLHFSGTNAAAESPPESDEAHQRQIIIPRPLSHRGNNNRRNDSHSPMTRSVSPSAG